MLALFVQISDILERDETKLDIAMAKLNIPIFVKTQRTFLKEYTAILKTIADALNNLQGDKCPYAVLLPTLFHTKENLDDMNVNNSFIYCKPLLSAVINGFNKRFNEIMDFTNTKSVPALIATVTHPFFKLRWLHPEIRTLQQVDKITNILANAADEVRLELSGENLNNKNKDDSIDVSKIDENDDG